MEILNKYFTYEILLKELPSVTSCEIIDNELFMSPAPSTLHQRISRNLEFLMLQFTNNKKLGEVFDAPFDVIVDENNVVQPDLLFIGNANLAKLSKRGYEGVPDLVIEIISPSTFYRDSVEKKDFYEKVGVQEYWLIEPENRVVEVLVLENQKYQLFSLVVEKGVAQSKLLEGFEVKAMDIFPENKDDQ